MTEYVFVCSANYWRYLFLSLRSLFASNRETGYVVVYMTGEAFRVKKIQDRIRDARVNVRHVRDIGDSYWMANKIHLCESSADRVVYLDADVAVLQPLEQIWSGHEEDLIARPADITYTKKWYPEKWKAAIEAAGAGEYPFYSPGFMVFQNRSHRRLGQTWLRLTKAILNGELPLPANRFAEMYAFSIAASMEGLTHRAMPDHAHRYAFLGEKPDDAIVHHLGTPGFYRHYLPIERARGWRSCRDLPVPRPKFTPLHGLYARIRHRLRGRLIGPRANRLDE